jgi:hypothetical protein
VAETTVKRLLTRLAALAKRWGKFVNIIGGYVEKYMFFYSRFVYHIFYVSYHL